jgi:hypothetical protein
MTQVVYAILNMDWNPKIKIRNKNLFFNFQPFCPFKIKMLISKRHITEPIPIVRNYPLHLLILAGQSL